MEKMEPNSDTLKPKSIYKETYENYLKQLSSVKIKTLLGNKPWLFKDGEKIKIQMLQSNYFITDTGIFDEKGKIPSIEKCVVLSKYLLSESNALSAGRELLAFSAIKEAGPLVNFYRQNVEKPISNKYSNDYDKLQKACLKLGGNISPMELPYDFTAKFNAMPQIAIYLLFNFADNEFRASCKVMFEKVASMLLDPECLAILATLFSNKLVRAT
jgi:hypothetical protein